MKMEHVVLAEASGMVTRVVVSLGDTVRPGDPLCWLAPVALDDTQDDQIAAPPSLDDERADLAEVVERHALGLDERRPDAVARRRRTGQRTARENIEDLCDP